MSRRAHVACLRRALALLLAVAGASAFAPVSAAADVTCSRVAAPGGSDAAAGTVAAPFATPQKLVDSLSAGQVGCLRAGTYDQSVTFSHGGASGAPITLTTYPGDQRATVVGRMWLKSGADDITVSGLNLNGSGSGGLPSPTVDDAYATFTGDDVTNDHTAICFDLGDDTGTWGRASHTLIQGNRIHHCGKLPAANHDHGIYVEASAYAQILDNVIYDNADRGVQLYPDAQHTVVEHNVIDGNGEGVLFSGDFGLAASDNLVSNNLITDSNIRNNVESWYPSGNPSGQGNLVTGSCVHGGVDDTGNGGIDTSGGGFTVSGNVNADPGYANPAGGDFTLRAGSPCAGVLSGSGAPLTPFPAVAGSSGSGTTAPVSSNPSTPSTPPPVSPPPTRTVAAAPASVTVPSGTVTGGSAGALAAADGVNFSVNATGKRTRTTSWYITFTATPSDLQGLRVQVRSAASASCSQTVSIYSFSVKAWLTLDARSVGTGGTTLGMTVPGTPSSYVSAGMMRVRVACSARVSFTHRTDLLSVSYTTSA